MQYTEEQKNAAIKAYIANGKNATKTVRELGYPSIPGLINWYEKYRPVAKEKPKKEQKRYTEEEIRKATDLYFKNGCNLKKTVRELGYGSETGLLTWLRKRYPNQVSKPTQRGSRPDVPEEIKQQAMLDMLSDQYTSAEVSKKYHVSRATLYEWKIKYIGEGNTVLKAKPLKTTEDYEREIEQLRQQKEQAQRELEQVQKQLYRAQLEKDVYEKAAEILKKEMACSLKDFTPR